jgi:hypothetical protein
MAAWWRRLSAMSHDAVAEPPVPDIPGLATPPPGLAATRVALHRLAEDVLSPVQAAVNGDIHFVWTPGGFGTPRFGAGRQLRVEGAEVVEIDGGNEVRREHIAGVDDAAARWLGELFGFGSAVLADLVDGAPDASPVRLWPEHFDIATEAGDEARAARATYGVSPGDAEHAEPYLYVAPWSTPPGPPELWVAHGFTGAELGVGELRAHADQRAAALDFFRERRAALGD